MWNIREIENLDRLWHVRLRGRVVQRMARINDRVLGLRYRDLRELPVIWPEESRFDGGSLEFQVLHWPGKDRPLVYLHGLNSNAWACTRLASLLAPERDVWAFSQRGHGTSDSPLRGYGLEESAADLYAFLDAHFDAPVDLAGESWGGKVALFAAANDPARFRSLALVDPVRPAGFNPFLDRWPGWIVAAFRQERSGYPDETALLRGMKNVVYLPLKDKLDRRAWRERFTQLADGRFVPRLQDESQAELVAHALARDIREQVYDLETPTLVLVPKVSIAFWPGEDRDMEQNMPNITLRKVHGDHTLTYINPFAAAMDMQAFWAKLDNP